MNRAPGHSASFVLSCLCLITLAVFLQVHRFDFINFDDGDYVTGNRVVQRGTSKDGIVWAFRSTQFSNWHPLTWLSHMLDCQLFSLNAGGHHLASVLLHLINTGLLFTFFFDDRGTVAQHVRRRGVRTSSPARRVGRLDRRAQGRPQHIVLDADDARPLRVCTQSERLPTQARRALLHSRHFRADTRIAGQTDAGDVAICPAAAGLLAARSISKT